MKHLILMRHAKSSWDHPDLSDHDRPLNLRGRTDAPRMAEYIAAELPQIQKASISTSERTQETWSYIAAPCKVAEANLNLDARLYLAGIDDMLQVLREFDDADEVVFLLGHNPGTTMFANNFKGAGFANVPTAGVIHIELEAEHWSEVVLGGGTVQRAMFPCDLPN